MSMNHSLVYKELQAPIETGYNETAFLTIDPAAVGGVQIEILTSAGSIYDM